MSSKEVRAGAAFVELFVKDNKLAQGLRAASARIKAWAASTKQYMQSIGRGLMSAGAMGFGVGAGIGAGLFGMTKSFADAGDQIDKMSHRTGMSARFLSEMGYAAQQCGADIKALGSGVRYMQMLMLDAGKGKQGAIDKLAALGLSYKQLARLSPEKQFETIVARLGQMDEARRAAHTMNIFGRSASSLVPLINAGTHGIAELRAEARRLGVSMSNEQAASATKFSDALTRIQAVFRGLVNQIGAALAPELTRLADRFTKYASIVVKMVEQNKGLIISFARWTAIIAGVGAGVMALGVVFWGLGAVAGAVLTTVAVALKVVAGLVKILISPFGLVIAALAGVLWYFGVLQDAIEWMKATWAPLFTTVAQAWKGIGDALAAGRLDLAMKVAWAAMKLTWQDGVNFLYKWWLWLQLQFQNAWNFTIHVLATAFMAGWAAMRKGAANVFFGIQTAWVTLVKNIRNIWTTCVNFLINAFDTAYTRIAKGLAWIHARLTGQDADAMIRKVEVEHRNRVEGRATAQRQQNAQFDEQLAAIGRDRQASHDQVDGEQNMLHEMFGEKYRASQDAYDAELARMQADRLKAEQELNDAVAEAAAARAAFETADPAVERRVRDLHFEAGEVAAREIRSSSSGTFSAAAIQSLQASGPMDRVAKNTEETAKYVKKQFQKKEGIAVAG